MNNITLTDEQMKALQSGQSITIEPPKTTWEPKGGEWTINLPDQCAFATPTYEKYANAGMEYQTQTQAEQATKALRSYARQLAYLAENDDGWFADWSNKNQEKHFVVYVHEDKSYQQTFHTFGATLNLIYMSQANATKLCNLLNSGVVEF